ncbi:LamG-like jellyroll fold domain-containing protein [Paenibacillus eucommiae]|nr:LamG-like jellyroll fold domain-containing protein [Paenibacillus eucommiae]
MNAVKRNIILFIFVSIPGVLGLLMASHVFAWVPSPETWTNIPDKWFLNVNGGTNELDETVMYGTGTRSNKMTGHASTGTYVVLDKPWTPSAATQTLYLKAWYKTANGYTGSPKIKVMYLTRWGSPNPSYSLAQETIVGSPGDHDWQQLSATLTVPVNTSKLLLELVSETDQGTVWFDEISVAAAGPAAINRVQNPSFEDLHSYMADHTFFNLLNLDAPGLSAVKAAVQDNNMELAKSAFLDYYKARTAPLQIGGRNGNRPPADPYYETYLADLTLDHYLTQRDGERYSLGTDVNWPAFAPDGSSSTLAIKNYFPVSKPAAATSLILNFDKNTGNIAGDLSGYANHGTIQGTPEWTNGKFDYGLNVSHLTYVTVANSPSLSLTEQISLEGWFKWNGDSYDSYGIHKDNAYALSVVNADGYPAARVFVDGQWRQAVSDQQLTSGVWHHLAMTYSASAKEIKLYVNGKLNQTYVLPSGLGTYQIHASTNELVIGRNATAMGSIFKGAVDGIIISNSVKDSFGLGGLSLYHGMLADAYWNTGNEDYAEEMLALMLDWYKDNQYREYEYASEAKYASESPISAVVHPGWQSLTEGIRLQNWIWQLHSIRDSQALTPNKFTALMKSMYEHAGDLSTRHQTGDNGAIAQMIALYQFAALFPEFQASAGWKSLTLASLTDLIKSLVYPDGTEIELSTLYQVATISNGFLVPYNLEQLNNWNDLSPAYKKRLEYMYQYLMYIAKPDGTAPLINDSNITMLRERLLEGSALFDREDMKYVATKGNEGTAPAHTSYGFPYAGQYAMRSGWDSNALYLAMDAGPLGVSHYHEDKLSFDLSAYGKNFISDPGLYSYDGNKWTQYFASTESHNTLLVDDLPQNRNSAGPFSVTAPVTDTVWESGKAFDYVSGEYTAGYGPGKDTSANQKREIFFAKPDYWILRDRITGTGVHKLQNSFQFQPMPLTIDPITKVTETNNISEANLRVIPVDPSGLEASYTEGQESLPPEAANANDADTRLLLHLDEGAGAVVQDTSSNGMSGAITGTPTWISGKFNSALKVSGSSYLSIPDNNSLDITDEITIEGWFQWDGTKQLGYGINKRNAYGLAVVDVSGLPTGWVYVDGQLRTIQAYQSVIPNEWYHMAMTYSSYTKQLRMYVNGELKRTIVLPKGLSTYAIGSSTYDLRIGTDYYGNSLTGAVDEIRISSKVRVFPQIGGWYSPYYANKQAAPQVKYVKQAANLPAYMDFVMYPIKAGENPDITVARQTVTINGAPASPMQSSALSITRNEGTDLIVISEPGTGNKLVSGYLTDAEVSMIRKDIAGNRVSMSIMNGYKLKDTAAGTGEDELITVLSPHAASRLTAAYEGTVLEIDTTLDLPNTECVQIYAPAVTSVKVNGQIIDYQKKGNYIIVGHYTHISDSSTVLLLHMDEGQGTAAGDVSAAGNAGTVNGSTYWSSSRFDNAISTYGGSGYVRIEDSDSLDITEDLTVEGWVKCDTNPCSGYLLQKGLAYGLKAGDGNGYPIAMVYVDGGFRTAVSNEPLTGGVWHHLAMTYSSVMKTLHLYVDGKLKASSTLSGLNTYSIRKDSNWLALGRDSMGWGGGNVLEGYIDEVRVSNTTRAEFSLNKPYAADSNTVLLLHVNEGQGTAAGDASAAGNTGTVNGSTNWSSSRFGNAISTSGGSGYIRIEDSDSLDITEDLTVEGWVKCDTNPCSGYLLQKGLAYGLKAGDGNGYPIAMVYVDGSFRTAVSHEPLTGGVWHHLAMTYSSAMKTLNLYVDGRLKASSTLSGLNTYSIRKDSNWLALGRDSMGWGGGNILEGYMDEVRVSNAVRTDLPIRQ